MTTTQIIIAFASFTLTVSIVLIGVIWADAKKSISEAVKEKQCARDMSDMATKLSKHTHEEVGGKARVEL